MATSPTASDRSAGGVPTVTVKSDGRPLDPTIRLTEVFVSRECNRISRARIEFADGDPAEEDFRLAGSDALRPGAEIELHFGRGSDEEVVFKGVVHRQRVQLDHLGKPSLRIDAADRCVAMTVQRRSRSFAEIRDSDVIAEVAREAGVDADIPETAVEHRQLVQFDATDWDFALTRLEANGLLALSGLGKLEGISADTSQDPATTLLFGEDLLEFEAELDARTHSRAVAASAWSPDEQALISVSSEETGISTAGDLTAARAAEVFAQSQDVASGAEADREELRRWATALTARQRLGHVRGRFRIRGTTSVLPGQTVEIRGVGARMNGRHFVSGVHHRYRGGEWITELSVGLSPTPFSESTDVHRRRAAGLLPAAPGLQIGVVTALADDPDSRERIRVRLPLLEADGDGVWARLAAVTAGDGRGFSFRPEIGDEVVCGFCDDDPRAVIVLGSLYSAAHPPAIEASDENPRSAYTTKSGMQLRFDDEEVSVVLETPNGNRLSLSDASGAIVLSDEHGNEIRLGSGGIELKSSSDVAIQADVDLKLNAAGNFDGEASGSATVKGSASTEVSSAGNTTVKGAMVMIN